MAGHFPVVIHHNPECGTSRNVLAIIEAADYSPVVIDYLREGWTRPHLLALFAASSVTAREALREKKTPAAELGLLDPAVTDDELIAAMIAHPVLVQRPFVATPKGVRLCRPDSGLVLDLLAQWPKGPFAKEDGTLLIDAEGRRV
jgi:arsenate reductase